MKNPKFYLCKHCKNLVEMIESPAGVPVICCGEPMQELVPGAVEASHEKHIPVVKSAPCLLEVTVGSVEHPMLPEHYIEWICLVTEHGCQRHELAPGDAPKAFFSLTDGETPLAVFAFCNIHGLWKTEL